MVLAAKIITLRVQIHPRQCYRGGGNPPTILGRFCQYGGLVGPDDVASLKYCKPRYLTTIAPYRGALRPRRSSSNFQRCGGAVG